MKVDILLTPCDVSAERVAHHCVVVIDVFRATSCICTAMENGAKRLIPLTTIDECLAMRDNLNDKGHILLGGERKTRKIEGFDLDNSPLSYSRSVVEGSTVIMSTTNGTRAINAAAQAGASAIGIACLLNGSAAADFLGGLGRDVAILCAGRHDRFTMEDALCAGYIARLLNERHTCELSDIAWSLADMEARYTDDLRVPLRNCTHYNQILEGGLADDVAFCLQRDIFSYVPRLNSGAII